MSEWCVRMIHSAQATSSTAEPICASSQSSTPLTRNGSGKNKVFCGPKSPWTVHISCPRYTRDSGKVERLQKGQLTSEQAQNPSAPAFVNELLAMATAHLTDDEHRSRRLELQDLGHREATAQPGQAGDLSCSPVKGISSLGVALRCLFSPVECGSCSRERDVPPCEYSLTPNLLQSGRPGSIGIARQPRRSRQHWRLLSRSAV